MEGKGFLALTVSPRDGGGGLVGKMQEGRGSLGPRGLGFLRFDGQPVGWGSASAWSVESH